jgi:uncharacterized protein involved in type VI secretion and phage assembly
MTNGAKFYGLYRGTVVDNADPEQRGRIKAAVADVTGVTPSAWAMPCVPMAGRQMGTFMLPPIGAGVWMQYEAGERDRPVWTGGWWHSVSEVPALALSGTPGEPNIVLQSLGQNAVMISDLPGSAGGIMLRSRTGATIIVNDTGIYIQNGKGASLVMVGPTVTINDGALAVT